MKSISYALSLVILAAPLLNAQTLKLKIERVGEMWQLNYQPSPQAGATMLHYAPNLSELGTTHDRIFDVPAASGPLTLDVSALVNGSRGFFTITEFPGLTAADFAVDEDDPVLVEVEPDYTVETRTAMMFPLSVTTPIRVHLNLLDGAGNTGVVANFNGTATFDLCTASGKPVAFSYTLTPSSLPVVAGVVDGMITISTSSSLVDSYIAVANVIPNATGPSTRDVKPPLKLANRNTGHTPKLLADYLNTSSGWHYPLPALVPVSGSFGEWRSGGSEGAGRPHLGFDLAAAPGTAVRPVKRGVVSKFDSLGSTGGQYMVVVHGDGTASSYLHIVPVAQVHQVVEPSTMIARVADTAADHLHLELWSGVDPVSAAGGYISLGASPGQRFDPGHVNAAFDTAPIQGGVNDVSAPQIKALYLWDRDPKTSQSAATASSFPILNRNGAPTICLIAQIVDEEEDYELVPARVQFEVEDAGTRALVSQTDFIYQTEAEVRRLFQDQTNSFANFGYSRRIGSSKLPDSAAYHYWFKWNTSAYAGEKLGPREVKITASDRAGHTASANFRFGPELKVLLPPTVNPASATGETFDLELRSFLGPFPAGMPGNAKHSIKLSLADAGITQSWHATFEENGEADLIKELGGHDETSKQTVQIRVRPRNAGSQDQSGEMLTILAESKLLPGLAHEIKVPIGEFSLIPAGNFLMGDNFAESWPQDSPVHTVYVSAFYMGKYEVTDALWESVRTWGAANGYTDLPTALPRGPGKGSNHPVHTIKWYDMVKWCNARSQRDGLTPCYTVGGVIHKTGFLDAVVCNWNASGYRLPTEAEWEKAARGGLSGKRYPWGDMISHAQANFFAYTAVYGQYGYLGPTVGYHPTYDDGNYPFYPYSSPVGSFAPNGYGLYDMTGNMRESVWDWYGSGYYAGSPTADPRGPSSGSYRVARGGGWETYIEHCRVASRLYIGPGGSYEGEGFRLSRRSVP